MATATRPKTTAQVDLPPLTVDSFATVPVDTLRPNPRNVRDPKRDDDRRDLVQSIAEQGILVPLLVLPDRTIVAGHRRHLAGLAAQDLYHKGIDAPVICRDLDEAQQIEAMLAENLQRADITPVEEAKGYQALLDLGVSTEAIETYVGTKSERVRRRIALLALPNAARELLETGGMTLTAAEELARLVEHPKEIERLIKGARGGRGGDPIRHFYDVDQTLRRIANAAKKKAVLDRLKKAGTKVIARPSFHNRDGSTIEVGKAYYQLDVDVKAHAKLPCHAVALDEEGKQYPCCTNPTSHPEHKPAPQSGHYDQAAHDARRAAAAAAQQARLAQLQNIIKADPIAVQRQAELLRIVDRQLHYDDLLCELLGIPVEAESNSTQAFTDWLVGEVPGSGQPRDAINPLHRDMAAAVIELLDVEQRTFRMLPASIDDTDDPFDLTTLHWTGFLAEHGWQHDDPQVAVALAEQRLTWSVDLRTAFLDPEEFDTQEATA